ncbi:MAG: putative dithiol-disulfide oxidoreductase (DUF899 family) [Gammaproteobacteria bacterium]|jgi:predicted dithiol-disulfide oxidoreductase (DUF899 family)
MADRKIVSKEQWLAARLDHLAKEKEFTRARDELSRSRRELPWTLVDKDYRFTGLKGDESLSDLFDGRSQLLVYHFMFGTDWEQGCKSCSLLADSYNGAVTHLAHRDVTMVTASIGSLTKLEAFKQRMGWDFKWVSSHGSEFNRDYNVSFTEQERADGSGFYNFRKSSFPMEEAPGISAFIKDSDGKIYHTYSAYGRGLDMFISTYHLLDIMPNGRDEAALPYSMQWVRHHDRYDDPQASDAIH